MHFMLEFYGDRLTGRRTSLEHFTTEDVTLGEARIQATSILRYMRFAGGMADLCNLCIIKKTSEVSSLARSVQPL